MRRSRLALLTFLLISSAAGAQRPSLQAQLAADRVPPGSALERLIAANQDFDLLKGDAGDRLPVPAWLRVLWRKRHPSGPYPFVLKEVHEWMVSHPDLEPGEREADVLPFQVFAGVGVPLPNLRISGRAPNPRSEVDIQVFELDPRRIVAASNNVEGSGRQAQYWSADGGATWGQTTLELIGSEDFNSDPTVGWTSDGTAWSSTLGIDEGVILRLRLFKSTDGGATWTFDSLISGDQDEADKQMVEVDTWAGSPFRDSLYAIWHNGAPVFMNRRRADGTWGAPRQVSGLETTGTGIGADVETNAAGHVFGLWPDTGSRRIFLVKSTDGGESWSPPAQVATTHGAFDIGIPAQTQRRVLIYVAAGAWKAPGQDLVYAAWTDLTGGSSCHLPAHEPWFAPRSSCKTRIWFTRSTDGGVTWKAKRMLHHPQGRLDQFNPALVVDPATGHLALIYYQTGEGFPGRRRTHLWYQASYDQGRTWTAPIRVTTARTDESGAEADDSNQFGDYNGITGYAGIFFPAWTDRRGKKREEIWTAPVVDGGPE